MKKFFGEFKKFITRGNIVDMAVGVIVGSSFTAIVNALSNNVLKPVVNWFLALILGADTLTELYTPLKYIEKVDENGKKVMDLEKSIYIDWGAFITAIINFMIIAIVLFCIVKAINKMREDSANLEKKKLSKEDRKAMKAQGLKPHNKKDVKAYLEKKAEEEAAAKAKADEEAKAKAEADRLANPTTEDLLKAILLELQSKN